MRKIAGAVEKDGGGPKELSQLSYLLRPEQKRGVPTAPVDPHGCGLRRAGLAGGRVLTCAGGCRPEVILQRRMAGAMMARKKFLLKMQDKLLALSSFICDPVIIYNNLCDTVLFSRWVYG